MHFASRPDDLIIPSSRHISTEIGRTKAKLANFQRLQGLGNDCSTEMPQLWHVLFTEGPKSWVELGGAEIRCSNGCSKWRVGFSFPPGGERGARRELADNWHKVVEKT